MHLQLSLYPAQEGVHGLTKSGSSGSLLRVPRVMANPDGGGEEERGGLQHFLLFLQLVISSLVCWFGYLFFILFFSLSSHGTFQPLLLGWLEEAASSLRGFLWRPRKERRSSTLALGQRPTCCRLLSSSLFLLFFPPAPPKEGTKSAERKDAYKTSKEKGIHSLEKINVNVVQKQKGLFFSRTLLEKEHYLTYHF